MSLRNEIIKIFNELVSQSKRITDLPAASTLTGSELIEVVQGGVSKKTTVTAASSGPTDHWKGLWVWADNADADPDWSPGDMGLSVGDRGVPGDANYVQDGALIVLTEDGFIYK